MKETVKCSLDNLGGYASICVDTRVFCDTAILKTAYWLTDKFYLYLSMGQEEPYFLYVEIRLKEKHPNSKEMLEDVCREFNNLLVDQEVRQKILAETSTIRDTLVQKAFFEGKPRVLDTNSK